MLRFFPDPGRIRTFFLGFSLLAATVLAADDSVFRLDFSRFPEGMLSEKSLLAQFENCEYAMLDQRATIVPLDGDPDLRVLRLQYPKGKLSPSNSGGQAVFSLPPSDEYYLSYRLRFGKEFEWTRGGKLPGLASGGSRFTGGKGKPDGTGWSARYMWRSGGRFVVYLYHPDQPGEYGEDFQLEGFTAKPDTWISLVQRIRLNRGNSADGVLQVWVDGQLRLDLQDVRFRKEPEGRIDSFLFSTFYGGSSDSFRPKRDHEILFDEFRITGAAPERVRE